MTPSRQLNTYSTAAMNRDRLGGASRHNTAPRKSVFFSGAAAVTVGLTTIAFSGAANAQNTNAPSAPLSFKTDYFGYAASVSPQVSYSDNNNLQQDGFEDDALIGSARFNASGIYSNSRFTGIIDGDLGLSYIFSDNDVEIPLPSGDSFIIEEEDFAVNQRIGATGTATIVENLAYFDISGSTNRQLIGDNAAFSRNTNAARGARANVHSVILSPYVNRKFGNDSTAELRYRFSQVFVDDETNGGFSVLNDSQSHEIRAGYDSGDAFDRLTIAAVAYYGSNDEFGSDAVSDFGFDQFAVGAEGEYALSTRFAVTGAIGYDDISSDAPDALIPDEDLSGVFWRAGFRTRPGRKTDLRLEYGERFGDGFVSGDLSYRFSRRFSFNAFADREFRSRTQSAATNFTSLQRRTLEFADSLREGTELSPERLIRSASALNNGVGAQTIGIGATNRVGANLIGAFNRTQISGNFNFSDDDFNFRQVETIGGGLAVNHQFSRKLSAYGDVFYRHADTTVNVDECIANPGFFGFIPDGAVSGPEFCMNFAATNGVTDSVGGRIGAQYRVYRNVSAFAEYAYTQRFSENTLLEFGENLFSAGFTYTF